MTDSPGDGMTGPELAAFRLKVRSERMGALLQASAPTALLEEVWNLIHEAYDELRHELEKKVSEG